MNNDEAIKSLTLELEQIKQLYEKKKNRLDAALLINSVGDSVYEWMQGEKDFKE